MNTKNIIIVLLLLIVGALGYLYITQTSYNQIPGVTEPNQDVLENKETATQEELDISSTQASTSVIEEDVAMPYIDSISPTEGEIGTVVTLKGKNMAGYSGDLDAWIEGPDGKIGFLPAYGKTAYPETNTITVQIPESVCTINISYSGKPCTSSFEIEPGEYKIYTRPWGNESNKVKFTVTTNSEEQVDVSKQDAFIIEAYSKNEKDYIIVDYIDNMHGDEALEAMKEDGKCEVGMGCMVYPNGYKRNLNPQLRTLEVSPSVTIQLGGIVGALADDDSTTFAMPNDGTMNVSFDVFSEYVTRIRPYETVQSPFEKPKTYIQIDVKNGQVTKINEPYQS